MPMTRQEAGTRGERLTRLLDRLDELGVPQEHAARTTGRRALGKLDAVTRRPTEPPHDEATDAEDEYARSTLVLTTTIRAVEATQERERLARRDLDDDPDKVKPPESPTFPPTVMPPADAGGQPTTPRGNNK